MSPMLLLLVASPEPVKLHWSAPRGCPSEAEIRGDLGRILADVPQLDRPLVADAQIQRRGKFFVLDLRLHNDIYEESVRYKRRTCDALGEMAVLYIDSIFPKFRSTPAPEPAPKPAAPVPPKRPPRRLGGLLRIGGVVGGVHTGFSGPLAPLGGPSLHLGVRGRRWRFEAGGLYLATPTRNYQADQSPFKASWQVFALQASACGAVVVRPAAELHLCGGLEAGALRGRLGSSELVVEGGRSLGTWLAMHAGAMLTVRLHRVVHLWARAAPGLAHTGRTTINVNKMPVSADRMWWQIRGALGVEVRWGS